MRLPRLTKPYKFRDYKFSLVLLVFALSVIGVMVVGSAKASVQNKRSEQADFWCLCRIRSYDYYIFDRLYMDS